MSDASTRVAQIDSSSTPDVETSPEDIKLAHSIIRNLFSREQKGLSIKRENFNEVNTDKTKRIKFEQIFRIVQKILQNTYGMQLVAIKAKEVTTHTQRKKKTQASNSQRKNPTESSFALVSVLPEESRQVLGELWQKDVSIQTKLYSGQREISDKHYFNSGTSFSKVPLSNMELLKNGILSLIISIIVFNGNRIAEPNLISNLINFGLSPVETNSSLNMNLIEFLNQLVKAEFLNRHTFDDKSAADYTLGRRSLAQISQNDIFQFVKNIYGPKFDLDTQARVLNSLKRVYGEVANIHIQSQSVTPD